MELASATMASATTAVVDTVIDTANITHDDIKPAQSEATWRLVTATTLNWQDVKWDASGGRSFGCKMHRLTSRLVSV